MLYRVDKKPSDLLGLLACFFTGSGSVSVIVDDEWGHFKRTGFFSGVFVIGKSGDALRREGITLIPIRQHTASDKEFIHRLAGAKWFPWHNCFNILRPLWKMPS